jgi:hypothetical protein
VARRVRTLRWLSRGVTVSAYFNNDWNRYPIEDARGLIARLEGAVALPHQRKIGEEGPSRLIA